VVDVLRTLRWPLKCCSSLISRRARLARIFLLKTLVTFLMATPSPVALLVAALCGLSACCTVRCWAVLRCSAVRVLFSPDNAVGALAQFLGHVVALVHNKLLVEDLEDLAVREVRHGGGGRKCAGCACCVRARACLFVVAVDAWRGRGELEGTAARGGEGCCNCKRVSETRRDETTREGDREGAAGGQAPCRYTTVPLQ
jgi:hypothetical protein